MLRKSVSVRNRGKDKRQNIFIARISHFHNMRFVVFAQQENLLFVTCGRITPLHSPTLLLLRVVFDFFFALREAEISWSKIKVYCMHFNYVT